MKFKAGDLFNVRLKEKEFICGRILLDVKQQCIKPRLIPDDSPLGFFNGSVLVEIYRDTFSKPTAKQTEALVSGMFVRPAALDADDWPIVGHEVVDPERVEFPEFVTGAGSKGTFARGEIQIKVSLSKPVEELEVYGTKHPSGIVPQLCLYQLGRKKDITDTNLEDLEVLNLKHSDLRFSPNRAGVYRDMGEDEKQSYFEMSQKLGHDIRRFYKL